MPAQHQAQADESAEREKFERWAKANTPLKFERDLASYFSGTTQFAWMAWIERAEEVSAHVEAGEMPAKDEPCPNCGEPVTVKYGPDIRFNPPCSKPQMWRAECSGDCLNPSWTRFTREQALESWNSGIRRTAAPKGEAGEMNQCDGCMQRAPMRGKLHIDEEGRAFMACERDKYAVAPKGEAGEMEAAKGDERA